MSEQSTLLIRISFQVQDNLERQTEGTFKQDIYHDESIDVVRDLHHIAISYFCTLGTGQSGTR